MGGAKDEGRGREGSVMGREGRTVQREGKGREGSMRGMAIKFPQTATSSYSLPRSI